MPRRALAVALILVVVAICGVFAQQNPRLVRTPGAEPFEMRAVASGLGNPWEVTWGPDGHLWITERTGFRVTRVNPVDGSRQVALTLDDVYTDVQHDGLLGLVLHPDLLRGRGRDYVYLAYTYDADAGPSLDRRLRIRRYTYNQSAQTLASPMVVLENLPAHDDHGGGRLVIGSDLMLYVSRGDHGANFLANYCLVNRAQDLPTAAEVGARDWSTYQGKILRTTLDGAIPRDNPTFRGVRSHVYSYGWRNPQGLSFGPTGLLYASEHGPSTDDEVNLIQAGGNYGWPHIAGFKDDRSYVFAKWSVSSPDPCPTLKFNNLSPPPSVPIEKESDWREDFVPPLATFFTVPAGYDLRASGSATIAPASIEVYTSTAIPGWRSSLLVTGMRAGRVYRLKLSDDGKTVVGQPPEYFARTNRYRDTAVAPDGKRIFLVTDSFGATSTTQGERTEALAGPGALLEFTYAPDSKKER